MSTLVEYLAQKRDAILRRHSDLLQTGAEPRPLEARVRAEGRSGIRRIRIRDFQILSDSDPDFAGYDLGPTSPELQLGVSGSCITHVFLIQAATLGVPLDSLEVRVQGQIEPRSGQPGFEDVPRNPHSIRYTVTLASSASDAELAVLHEAVKQSCPILHLLRNPQIIQGALVRA